VVAACAGHASSSVYFESIKTASRFRELGVSAYAFFRRIPSFRGNTRDRSAARFSDRQLQPRGACVEKEISTVMMICLVTASKSELPYWKIALCRNRTTPAL
jgi:hypothetical protein